MAAEADEWLHHGGSLAVQLAGQLVLHKPRGQHAAAEAVGYTQCMAAEADTWLHRGGSQAEQFFKELCDPCGQHAATVAALAAAIEAALNDGQRELAQLVAAAHIMADMQPADTAQLKVWTCVYWCAISSSRGGKKGGAVNSPLQRQRSELYGSSRTWPPSLPRLPRWPRLPFLCEQDSNWPKMSCSSSQVHQQPSLASLPSIPCSLLTLRNTEDDLLVCRTGERCSVLPRHESPKGWRRKGPPDSGMGRSTCHFPQ